MTLIERVRLDTKANQLAGTLTLLERKRLELARALATGPKVLLLDEIGGGLVEAEIEALIVTIEGLRADGIAIVWIEHIVHALVSVVDRLLAVDFGRVLAQGNPEEVMASPEVQAVYMGVVDE
jgi:branched-chain amino acid transport system ATP-binding protein